MARVWRLLLVLILLAGSLGCGLWDDDKLSLEEEKVLAAYKGFYEALERRDGKAWEMLSDYSRREIVKKLSTTMVEKLLEEDSSMKNRFDVDDLRQLQDELNRDFSDSQSEWGRLFWNQAYQTFFSDLASWRPDEARVEIRPPEVEGMAPKVAEVWILRSKEKKKKRYRRRKSLMRLFSSSENKEEWSGKLMIREGREWKVGLIETLEEARESSKKGELSGKYR